MPVCVITLPGTVSPKTVSERLDLSFGIFARRGEKYSCYIQKVMQTRGYILAEYGLIAKELYKMGHKNEARLISRLAKDMVGQPLSTKAQREYDQKVSPQVQQEPHISKQTGIEQDNEPTR